MKMYGIDGFKLAFCLAGCVSLAALNSAVAQGDGPAVPPRATPPPPLMAPQQSMLDTVFARFPNVEREDMLRFIQEEFPKEMREFHEIARHHMGEAVDYLTDVVAESLDMVTARRDDPAQFELMMRWRRLESQAFDLAEAYRRVDDGKRDEIAKELRRVLGEGFETKQNLMQRGLGKMREEIERLESLIEKRQAKREAIIERRMDTLAGGGEELEW